MYVPKLIEVKRVRGALLDIQGAYPVPGITSAFVIVAFGSTG